MSDSKSRSTGVDLRGRDPEQITVILPENFEERTHKSVDSSPTASSPDPR